MEQTLTPEESLQIIQKSISNSRKNLREGSIFYLVWGWTLILASLSNYFVIGHYVRIEQYQKINLMSMLTWGVFVLGAMLIQFLFISRKGKEKRVLTHLDWYLKIIWTLAGLLMVLMVFLSLKVSAYPTPFILGVTAMATAVSGLMVKFRQLVMGAVVFLIAAVFASFLDGTEQLLVFAGAVVFGYLVPGYILRTSKNGDNV